MTKLYIIGTPIGNLKDITFRAIETLQNVDLILCEDTRNSKILLDFYNIKKPLISYHNFNEETMSNKVIDLIKNENKTIALISDAGMPVISDPGFYLIKKCYENEIDFDIISGPTALIHAIIKANFASQFTFLGFLKDKSEQRKNQLKKLDYGVYVAYISPHKLLKSLTDFDEVFNETDYKIFLIKEMTKKFETFYTGTAQEIIKQLNNNIKGEFVIVFNLKKTKHLKINKYEKFSKVNNNI
ncbi:16S rRNA (cytidine(1402)-2'-O)-methyltransferase [Mycoplasma miroungirhinis]|uniref:Ribosomal RNA small subunit methyltransferase I n=1 Tax=Mycoplasma miroungirhinis TaxID=754516 RepID=A0A6M4JCR4_9MOLU|nr:16S rRNA (cytidine(1402)-2'-O)-methyltransferase [Mycoplasma miroungirhinis]QJR44068.1 16S rRNA (cytidine(1402)-2'-O)-methyltransferase [Mycoplasma miroungirhinis]